MENEIYATYLIPSDRVDDLVKATNKLAKRITSGKTHADFIPTVEVVKEVAVAVTSGNRKWVCSPKVEYPEGTVFYSFTWVTIHYQRPILNGWQLVAVYDWEVTDDGTRTCYVSVVPGMMVAPEFRNPDDYHCDHCHVRRRRKKSMLVTKHFTEFKIVGSTCVKDFLGHKNPQSFVEVFQFDKMVHDLANGGPTFDTPAVYSVDRVLAIAAMMVRKFGYVKTDSYDNWPTAYRALAYIEPTSKLHHKEIAAHPIEDRDKATAQSIKEWVLEQPTDEDYMSNLSKCINAGAISSKRFGILVSAAKVYQTAQERAKKVDTNKDNQWMGALKERLKGIQVEIVRVRHVEGGFGDTTIITMETPNGNTLVWFATGYKEVNEGEVWTIDGTVKRHDEFRGTRQTVLTRVKCIDIINKAA